MERSKRQGLAGDFKTPNSDHLGLITVGFSGLLSNSACNFLSLHHSMWNMLTIKLAGGHVSHSTNDLLSPVLWDSLCTDQANSPGTNQHINGGDIYPITPLGLGGLRKESAIEQDVLK